MFSLDKLKKNQLAKIEEIETDHLPLKLIEMGCLPGNNVELIHIAPFDDPLYFIIDDCHVAIRKKTASKIKISLI
tara:strand:+ start:80 stop:304 length:225 start_codon:yes stop_codon:yes gene_type:complete